MPTQKTTDLVPVLPKDDKEVRLATAIAALDPRERNAYKYFLQAKQEVSPDLSDELFQLYLQGADCEEIRRQRKNSVGLSLIVACRVIYDWDARRAAYRSDLVTNLPARTEQVQAEQVNFMADLLTATQLSTRKKVREYLATGDEKLLEGLPIPKNMREYGALFDMFLRGSGNDKKRIEVSGRVTHDHHTGAATGVSPDEAAGIIDGLLSDRAIDVEAVPVPAVQPQLVRTNEVAPRTPEEMIAFLARTGIPEDKARAMVESIGKDVENLSQRYSEIWAELVQEKKGSVN